MVNMNKHKNPSVYALHAGDHVYRYVGSTSVNSLNRLWQHNYRARSGHDAPVYKWMREVGIDNVHVTDLVLEADKDMREGLEVAAIVQLLGEGFPLVNSLWSKGGGLPVRSTEYQRIVNKAKPRKPNVKRPHQPKPTKAKAPRVPNHGTRTEWEKYKCKCPDCRLAGAQRNALKRGRPIPTTPARARGVTPPHGTVVRYNHYDCRCVECRMAGAEYRVSRKSA